MKVAIDVGHGYVKALGPGGARVCFPALIAPQPLAVDLGAFGAAAAPVWVNDTPYVVGDAARRWATPLWSRDKAADADTQTLLFVAAAECGAAGDVMLATGLPLSWYGAQRYAVKRALEGRTATVGRPDRTPVTIRFARVWVLPQGVAAAGPILAQPAFQPGPYVIVDLGYRTTDFIVVTKAADGRLTFDPAAAGSLELGGHIVTAAVAAELTATYQVPFTPAAVEAVPAVAVRGQRVDLAPLRERAQAAFVRQVARGLAEALDARLDQVLGIVAVGGASGWFQAALPAVIRPADAQWANAAGYWAALTA